MATRTPALRHDDEPAFVLHAYPYRETSLIVEAFTERHGRVPMVARGAKRPRSELRGLLQAFQLLTLSWAGAGELKTLVKADWLGGMPLPRGSSLLCGFYLNELLLKLLPREDPHGQLFAEYTRTLRTLAGETSAAAQAGLLRRFELRLLAELGYALPLTCDVESGAAIDAHGMYHYVPERGPRLATRLVLAARGLPALLAEAPLLLPTPETAMRAGFDAMVESLGIVPRIAAEADDMAMLRLLARSDAGVAVIPPIVVRDELAAGTLYELAQLPGITEEFHAVTIGRTFPNPLLREVLDGAPEATGREPVNHAAAALAGAKGGKYSAPPLPELQESQPT